jgi:hypothetical protein
MRTTVRLSEELLRKAKKKAAEKRQTLTSLIEEGLKIVLADAGRVPRRSHAKVPISKANGGTLPGVDLNRSGDLEDRMTLL